VPASRTIAIALLTIGLLTGAACDKEPDPVDTTPPPTPVASPSPVVSVAPPVTEAPSPTDLPPITVATPEAGDEISSPATVSGTADVFEATVSLRILDATGHVLVRDFTTATCGTGCRGEYEARLAFEVAEAQDGTVEVWWDSPKDGSRQDVISIPVRLLP
jgi:immunoglobulin-like protein involved in spore germination